MIFPARAPVKGVEHRRASDYTLRQGDRKFFAATIRNKNTRLAYYRAACNFFAWLEQHGIV